MSKKKSASHLKTNIHIEGSSIKGFNYESPNSIVNFNSSEGSHERFLSELKRVELTLLELQKKLPRDKSNLITVEMTNLKREIEQTPPNSEAIHSRLDKIKEALAGISSAGAMLKTLYDMAQSFLSK